ncbi:hypothetical protein [Halorussus halophilus]|uniref:hypothetical protein n=1 Tax=Halorussus halophilus TaxID=2650975 RepID=UPI0013013C7D|nr:hypothetical protein [Halorussus halophilus]
MNIDIGEVTAVIGQKNSGKSVLTEYLLTQMDRFIALDPNYEHGPPGASAVKSPEGVWRHWMEGDQRLVARDSRGALTEERMDEWVRAVCQLQEAYLLLDEMHNYTKATYCPTVLKKLVKYVVSHQNIGFVFGVHLASDIPSDIWSQIDNFIIFSYGDKWDSKMQDASIPDKRVVQELDPSSYQFLTYKDQLGGESKVRGPVPIPDHLS